MKRNNTKGKNIERNANIKKIFTIFLMMSFISFISYHLFLTIQIANEKLQILEIAEEDVAELRIQNLELVLEKSEIVSMEYIEKEARDKLRYSKEGEVLFVIPDELLNSTWLTEELKTAKGDSKHKEEKTPEEIFEIWIRFLFS